MKVNSGQSGEAGWVPGAALRQGELPAKALGWGTGAGRRRLDAAFAGLEQTGSKQEFGRPPRHPKSLVLILLSLSFFLSFPPPPPPRLLI